MYEKKLNNQNELLEFGEWSFDANSFELRNAAGERRLQARTGRVLLFLIKNAPRVVSRSELIENVWGLTALTDNAVTSAIAILRDALNDKRGAPKYIQTIPKRGYRFIGALKPQEGGQEDEISRSGNDREQSQARVDTPLFKRFSLDLNLEVMAPHLAGVAKYLKPVLATEFYKHFSCHPFPATEEFENTQTSNSFQIEAVGRIREEGGQLVISIQFDSNSGIGIDASKKISRRRFTQDLKSLVQSSLPSSAMNNFQNNLPQSSRTQSEKQFWRALSFTDRNDPEHENHAITLFCGSISLMPSNGSAHAILAASYAYKFYKHSMDASLRETEEAYINLIDLANYHIEQSDLFHTDKTALFLGKAVTQMYGKRNFDQALRYSSAAVETDPENLLAWRIHASVLSKTGNIKAALEASLRAAEFAPDTTGVLIDRLSVSYFGEQYDAVIQLSKDLVKRGVEPGVRLPLSLLMKGQSAEALAIWIDYAQKLGFSKNELKIVRSHLRSDAIGDAYACLADWADNYADADALLYLKTIWRIASSQKDNARAYLQCDDSQMTAEADKSAAGSLINDLICIDPALKPLRRVNSEPAANRECAHIA